MRTLSVRAFVNFGTVSVLRLSLPPPLHNGLYNLMNEWECVEREQSHAAVEKNFQDFTAICRETLQRCQ